jgi:hypothetical protein
VLIGNTYKQKDGVETFPLASIRVRVQRHVRFRKTARISMRTAAQAAVWTWIVLSMGWLAMVAWVAIVEPVDESVPWVYAMTAVVPPGSLLVFGAALTWTARAFQKYISATQ